jgi:hypothetical protein
MAALVQALGLLVAARRGARGLRAEVPLASVVSPLLGVRPSGSLAHPVEAALVTRLAEDFGAVPVSPLQLAGR